METEPTKGSQGYPAPALQAIERRNQLVTGICVILIETNQQASSLYGFSARTQTRT